MPLLCAWDFCRLLDGSRPRGRPWWWTAYGVPRCRRSSRKRTPTESEHAARRGARTPPDDLPCPGEAQRNTAEVKAWPIATDLGYESALRRTRLLAHRRRLVADAAGQPSLRRVGSGTATKMSNVRERVPDRVSCRQERRDRYLDTKLPNLMPVYRPVMLLREEAAAGGA